MRYLCVKITQAMNEEPKYTYRYPRPAVATDCVIFGFDGRDLHILLIERGAEPFKGMWALPGGYMHPHESAEECARRELCEETGIRQVYLEQFHTFSDPRRHPNDRVMTVAFYALVRKSDHAVIAGDDAAAARWFLPDSLPPLAFDHDHIIKYARRVLREHLKLRPLAFRLLDERFSMSELQRLYELINGTTYDRRNFQRKVLSTGYLESCGTSDECVPNRRPNLFTFDNTRFKEDCDNTSYNPFDI